MAKFNERLKLLRQETGLSQQDFAKQIGTSKSSINMYERGEREPGLETLEAIADYFNVDMDYLLGKSECRNRADYLEADKNLDHYDHLIITCCKGIASWSADKLTTIQDQAVYRMHFAELLQRYKLLLEKSVNIRFTSKHYLDSIKDFNESREHPLSEQELTKQYLDQELKNEIDSLTSWIKTITLYLSKDGKEPDK